MSFVFPTNASQVQAFAGALYGIQVGTTTMAQVNADIAANGGLASTLNSYYSATFGGVATSTVAATVATNLGLTGDALASGTAYVEAQLNAVAAGARGAVISSIVNLFGTLSADATFGAAATAWNAKVAVAAAYTGAANVAVGTEVVASSVFTLTTGVDSFTGSAGNDTFTADNTGTDTTSTADVLNGGAGTDTINIFSDGAAPALPALTSIETANIYDQDAAINLAGTQQDSLTTVNFIRGDGETAVTVGANVSTVSLTDIQLSDAAGDNATTANGVQFTLDADATTITLNASAITAAGTDADENITFVGADLATVVVNATGALTADVIDVAAASAVTINATGAVTTTVATTSTAATLTITGAGAVGVGQLDDGVDVVNASAATGAITMTVGADNEAAVITLGSGNDVVTTDDDGFATSAAFNVDAGAGTGDVLVVAAAADVDTAGEAARYDNFEVIRTAVSVDMSRVAGITALQITGGTSETYSEMTATQAANITFRGDNTTSTIFALADDSGSSDAATINLASTTATTNVDVIGISVDNIETVTFNATTGTNTTGDTAIGFLANSADEVTSLNFTGTADVTFTVAANTLDVAAVTIDASQMTGTADFTLVQTSDLVTGSSVTGTLNGDTIALGSTLGSSYNGGAGDDSFTGALALFVADGSGDTTLDGGTGDDTLTLSDTTTTLTDNHFTWISGMETLALSNTVGDASITTGAAFNAAFASGATITTGVMAVTKDVTLNAGLATVAIDLTIDATSLVGTAAETHSITTGTGADTVTFTGDTTYVGVAGATGTVAISTGAGADTISVTYGSLLANTTSQAFTITAGRGADEITKVGTNGAGATAFASFVVGAGDSTSAEMDTITGFDLGDSTNYADGLNFAGTAAIGTLATHLDSGTILSHSITTGIATFDDAATYNAAIVIDSSNLADVVAYLALNTATNDVVAFTYDSDDSGSADATIVYHNGTTDSVVLLAGVTTADALITTAGVGANDLFIA